MPGDRFFHEVLTNNNLTVMIQIITPFDRIIAFSASKQEKLEMLLLPTFYLKDLDPLFQKLVQVPECTPTDNISES